MTPGQKKPNFSKAQGYTSRSKEKNKKTSVSSSYEWNDLLFVKTLISFTQDAIAMW